MKVKTVLDRTLQAAILTKLAESYPFDIDIEREVAKWHPERSVVLANLTYLKQHGLVDMKVERFLSGHFVITMLIATHKGMDFMLDDGGLSRILDVVTVKLHEDTLTALLRDRILASDLPSEEKSLLSGKLEKLGDEGSKHLLTKALDYGLSNAPNAINWLSEFIKGL